jgi:hypothetical protein
MGGPSIDCRKNCSPVVRGPGNARDDPAVALGAASQTECRQHGSEACREAGRDHRNAKAGRRNHWGAVGFGFHALYISSHQWGGKKHRSAASRRARTVAALPARDAKCSGVSPSTGSAATGGHPVSRIDCTRRASPALLASRIALSPIPASRGECHSELRAWSGSSPLKRNRKW